MVNPIVGFIFCVYFLPISYGISEKRNHEGICFNNACYTVHLNKKTFTEAHKECTDRRGNLLTIRNEEEAGHVHSFLWKFTNTTQVTQPLKLWIGLQLKAKSCVDKTQALKGFSWIMDPQVANEDQFSNWLAEPRKTCIKENCVSMKLDMGSSDNYKWTDESCSSQADGYVCKFNFQGMCQRVALAGPGYVEYETPFRFKSSSLDLLPYGSSASVSCGRDREPTEILYCLTANGYQWVNPDSGEIANGPFCALEELSCKYNNGGCEHDCVEYPQNKSLSCRCRDGYVLAPDLKSCVYPDHCQSNPCEQKCINHIYGFECSCSSGFALAEDKVNCNAMEECLEGECIPNISKNEGPETEYNDTSSSVNNEIESQTSSHSIINVETESAPPITQSILLPAVTTAFQNVTSVDKPSGCNALRPGFKLKEERFGSYYTKRVLSVLE
ncbi:complement component C1q receptor-like [Dendropsophus ebraccatus]|uniref:complement component C1q receptor-like n=1 Tax=Dendropsophus ebraccatus TaxID=150705 RepID=UPI00383164DE